MDKDNLRTRINNLEERVKKLEDALEQEYTDVQVIEADSREDIDYSNAEDAPIHPDEK